MDPSKYNDVEVMPEKMQVEFKWKGENFRLDIPLENIDKIEVKIYRDSLSDGNQDFDNLRLENDKTNMFVHLRKPVTVYGEAVGATTKMPKVSPFDLSYDVNCTSAAQILNYWNAVQVI